MNKPVNVFFDFDGVFNWFVSRNAYRKHPDTLGYTRRANVYVSYPLRTGDTVTLVSDWYNFSWSAELVSKLKTLKTETGFNWDWLTTWVTNTSVLDEKLDVENTNTVVWEPTEFQPVNDTIKLAAVLNWVENNPGVPFVWVDDTAANLWWTTEESRTLKTPHLVIVPDGELGMLRGDLDELTRFVKANS